MLKKFSLIAVAGLLTTSAFAASQFPEPAVDDSLQAPQGKQVAVLAGGCFWGLETVFEHLNGVSEVVAGFAGGKKSTAHYEEVSTGTTGHAESVQITYNPAKITYGQILKVYFSVAHDPTEVNRQGPDSGTQYRSSIFYANDDQKRIAEAYIRQLNGAHVFGRTIATEVVPLKGFFAAEAYHQHYADLHPDQPYISYYDLPKVAELKKQYPEMCKK